MLSKELGSTLVSDFGLLTGERYSSWSETPPLHPDVSTTSTPTTLVKNRQNI